MLALKLATALHDPKELTKGIDALLAGTKGDNGHGTRHDVSKPVKFASDKWWE